jgi:hypothetical protein
LALRGRGKEVTRFDSHLFIQFKDADWLQPPVLLDENDKEATGPMQVISFPNKSRSKRASVHFA